MVPVEKEKVMAEKRIRKSGDKAVALRYNPKDNIAPIIVASGYGEVAKRIITVADQNNIPVYRDDSTASLLSMLEVGSGIPPELYQVIASLYTSILAKSAEIQNLAPPADENAQERAENLEQIAQMIEDQE